MLPCFFLSTVKAIYIKYDDKIGTTCPMKPILITLTQVSPRLQDTYMHPPKIWLCCHLLRLFKIYNIVLQFYTLLFTFDRNLF